jgi:SAM-dependent methyltransferase
MAAAYVGYPVHGSEEPRGERRRPSPAGRVYHALLALLRVPRRRQRLDEFRLSRHGNLRILEVGCGTGARLRQLRDLGHQVEGQDVVPAAAVAAARLGLQVHVGELGDLPLAAGRYDAIVLNHVLEHVTDPTALLATCRRLLRPSGTVLAVFPNGASRTHRRFGTDWVGLDAPRHLHVFTPASARAAGRRAGFERVRVSTTALRADDWTRMSLQWRARNRGQPPPTGAALDRAGAMAMLGLLLQVVRPGHGDEILLRLQKETNA